MENCQTRKGLHAVRHRPTLQQAVHGPLHLPLQAEALAWTTRIPFQLVPTGERSVLVLVTPPQREPPPTAAIPVRGALKQLLPLPRVRSRTPTYFATATGEKWARMPGEGVSRACQGGKRPV